MFTDIVNFLNSRIEMESSHSIHYCGDIYKNIWLMSKNIQKTKAIHHFFYSSCRLDKLPSCVGIVPKN